MRTGDLPSRGICQTDRRRLHKLSLVVHKLVAHPSRRSCPTAREKWVSWEEIRFVIMDDLLLRRLLWFRMCDGSNSCNCDIRGSSVAVEEPIHI